MCVFFYFTKCVTDLSNDEAEEDEEEPPNKTQRARTHLYNQPQTLSLKQRSLTPENLTDDQISFHRGKVHTSEKRLNHSSFEGSQGSLSRNNTLDRQHLRVPEKAFISSRSSSSSSCSEAENEIIGFRRSKNRASGKSAGENRIRRSR